MKLSKFWAKTLLGFLAFIILQACAVHKNSETHATVIYEEAIEDLAMAIPYNNDMISVAEHHEPLASLEALSASILLLDIQNRDISPRWEDELSFDLTSNESQPFISDEREEAESVFIRN